MWRIVRFRFTDSASGFVFFLANWGAVERPVLYSVDGQDWDEWLGSESITDPEGAFKCLCVDETTNSGRE